MPRDDRGGSLLEVIAGLAIVSLTGLAALELAGGLLDAAERSELRAAEIADQERLLTAYTLLTRSDLEQRIGAQRVGAWIVRVDRPEQTLFRVSTARPVAADRPELVTIVFRPFAVDAP